MVLVSEIKNIILIVRQMKPKAYNRGVKFPAVILLREKIPYFLFFFFSFYYFLKKIRKRTGRTLNVDTILTIVIIRRFKARNVTMESICQ